MHAPNPFAWAPSPPFFEWRRTDGTRPSEESNDTFGHMPEDAENDHADAPLDTLPRWLIGIAGLVLTASGTVAVFIRDTNVAGVALLITVGGAFLYVAFTSQRLLQVNKDGVTFTKIRQLQRTLRDVSKDPEIPTSTKVRIADLAEWNGIDLHPRLPKKYSKRRSKSYLRFWEKSTDLKCDIPRDQQTSAGICF